MATEGTLLPRFDQNRLLLDRYKQTNGITSDNKAFVAIANATSQHAVNRDDPNVPHVNLKTVKSIFIRELNTKGKVKRTNRAKAQIVADTIRVRLWELFDVVSPDDFVPRGTIRSITFLRIRPVFDQSARPFDDVTQMGLMLERFRRIAEVIIDQSRGQIVGSMSGQITAAFDSGSSADDAMEAVRVAIAFSKEVERVEGPPTVVPRSSIHTHQSFVPGTDEAPVYSSLVSAGPIIADELQRQTQPRVSQDMITGEIIVSDTVASRIAGEFHTGAHQEISLLYPDCLTDGPTLTARWLVPPSEGARSLGREDELRTLKSYLDSATSPVLLHGPIGVGKTRLLKEFERDVAQQGVRVLWARCYSGHENDDLYPCIKMIREVLGIEHRRQQAPGYLKSAIEDHGLIWRKEFGALESVLRGNAPNVRDARQIPESLLQLMTELALNARLVVIFQDIQWADTGTLTFLKDFLASTFQKIVTIVSFDDETRAGRPVPRWLRDRDHAVPMVLKPLPHAESVVVTRQHLRSAGLAIDDDLAEKIALESKGMPLRIQILVQQERRVQAGWEPAQRDPTNGRQIPDALAFVDDESTTRRVLELARALNEFRFPFELLHTIWTRLDSCNDAAELRKSLTRLRSTGLLLKEDDCGHSFWSFSAPDVFSAAARNNSHLSDSHVLGLVADVIEELGIVVHPARQADRWTLKVNQNPKDQAARHKAVNSWIEAGFYTLRCAGDAAVTVHTRGEDCVPTHERAIEYFDNALNLLSRRRGSAASRMKLRAWHGRLVARMSASYTSAELDKDLHRVRTLLKESGVADAKIEFAVERAAWSMYQNRSRLDKAMETADRLRALAESPALAACPEGLVEAIHCQAVTSFARGESFRDALGYQTEVAAKCADVPSVEVACLEFSDHQPGACCRIMEAVTRWLLGEHEDASRLCVEAFDGLVGHPQTEIVVECYAALLYYLDGDWSAAKAAANHACHRARECHAGHWLGMAEILLAAADGATAESESTARRAIADIDQGIRHWTSPKGLRGMVSLWEALRATVLLRLAEILPNGLGTADRRLLKDCLKRGIRFAENQGEQFFLADLYRLKAESHILVGEYDDARVWGDQAVALARRQKATSLLERSSPLIQRIDR